MNEDIKEIKKQNEISKNNVILFFSYIFPFQRHKIPGVRTKVNQE